MPESFLAVRAKAEGRPAVVRAVQTVPVGPFAAMQDLTFRGEYPFAWYSFVDPELPVRVSMEVFNPLIPLDEKNSAIPCAIWKLTAENPSTQAVEVSFLAAQQNAVGCIGNQYGGNVNQVLRENGTVVLHMTSRKDQHDPRYGDMALAMLPAGSAGQNAAVHGAAAWAGMDELAKQFAQQGTVAGENMAGPTAQGRTIAGALAAPLVVPPGGQATVTVLLTWHFPNAMHGGPAGWTRPGNMYANWWGDALDVLRYVQANLQDLDAKTRLFHDSLYATNLPYWLLDRISSQNAIFKSKTYWWSKDGYLGAWEGCCPESGCCEGNATHVGGYVVALPRLFPALGRRMREEALSMPQPSGAVPVRQTQAHLGLVAFDGLCHEVITCYREHLTSTSAAWLGTQWPGIKKSLDAAIARWDADEDGFLAGHKHGIDVDHSGCDPWLGGLYLCALAAAERMALLNNDAPAVARYGRILAAGKKNQNQRLWNGEYFIQIPDPQPGSDYNDGSYIDALLGQWHACQLDLGWMYPPERVQSAAGALFHYNFRTDFHGVKQVPRKFVADDDPGMQMGAWPRGPVPPNAILYHDEVMSGFEYTAAVAMVQAGLLREGFAVVRAAAQRYDGRLREGLTPGGQASWGFSGNPFGDDECGKYYKRAMSIWSMLLACQGMLYDGPAAKIGFLPAWKGEDHCSLFTAAEGWGLFTQKRAGAAQSERIELRCGRLAVRTLVFAGTEGFHPSQSKVTVAGKPVQSKLIQENGRVTIRLDEEYRIQASEVIEVELR